MIAILSDVHGNYPALKAVLNEIDKLNCNMILSLGDVCGYYCMINECIEELRMRNVINIMGNHDYYIVNNEKCVRSYTANLCLDYQKRILKTDNFKWIKQSVPEYKTPYFWAVHGGWNNFLDEYIDDFSFLDEESKFKFYFSGHTHVQKYVSGEKSVYINPGSVGQPRDYKNTAAFCLIDDKQKIIFKRVKYDIDLISKKMKEAGFPERVSSCLYYGVKIGEDEK